MSYLSYTSSLSTGKSLLAVLARRPSRTTSIMAESVVLIDADNVRASMGWPTSALFRNTVFRWAQHQRQVTPHVLVVIAVDGRTEKQHACVAKEVEGVLLTFSGARCKADDTIARDCSWWMAESEARVLVISSDKQLRKRCREAVSFAEMSRRAAGRLRLENSEAFASVLPTQLNNGRSSALQALACTSLASAAEAVGEAAMDAGGESDEETMEQAAEQRVGGEAGAQGEVGERGEVGEQGEMSEEEEPTTAAERAQEAHASTDRTAAGLVAIEPAGGPASELSASSGRLPSEQVEPAERLVDATSFAVLAPRFVEWMCVASNRLIAPPPTRLTLSRSTAPQCCAAHRHHGRRCCAHRVLS